MISAMRIGLPAKGELPIVSASISELNDFVMERLDRADEIARDIFQFSVNLRAKSAEAGSIAEIPRFAAMQVGYGQTAFAAILFVDMRDSSKRAEELGPRQTYLTIHAYLPAMAYVVSKFSAHVVGFRGDGLFAAFGLDATGSNPPNCDIGSELSRAVRCAYAMIEALDEVIIPALNKKDVDTKDLRIGIGIAAGDIVITRVGLELSNCELTAYGPAVNKASKLSDGNGVVAMDYRTESMFPSGKGGRIRFEARGNRNGLKVVYPDNYSVLLK
jgi:class 3 adenylate cyclase